MEKSEMMKRYEEEKKKDANDELYSGSVSLYLPTVDYIEWLESKASAYDRLMSGGKKTLKEMANFFGLIVSVEPDGDILLWEVIPNRSRDGWYGKKCVKRLPKLFSDFSGDWKDSLTLPDGWETKGENK